ncbi:MAG: ribonuclease H-like domain-containing protein [Candidatus Nanohalobium sp.]
MKSSQKELVLDIETDGLEPYESRIICIVAKDLQREKLYSFQSEDEQQMLEEFLQFYGRRNFDCIIGYNILFDIRFIFARALLHQVDGRGFFRTDYEDLMAVMKQVGYRYSSNNSGGLEDWIKLFFGEEKLMENGSVPEKYEQGKIQKIVEYCEQDVEVTAKLWMRVNSVVESHGFKRMKNCG